MRQKGKDRLVRITAKLLAAVLMITGVPQTGDQVYAADTLSAQETEGNIEETEDQGAVEENTELVVESSSDDGWNNEGVGESVTYDEPAMESESMAEDQLTVETMEADKTAEEKGEDADDLMAQDADTVNKGRFSNVEFSWGVYTVGVAYRYQPTNQGVTSGEQLWAVLEQLDENGTPIYDNDSYYNKGTSINPYPYTLSDGTVLYFKSDNGSVRLNKDTRKVRIRVRETVDGVETEYVSDTFDRVCSAKTPVFTLTCSNICVNSIDYKWQIDDYEPDNAQVREQFYLKFTYCPKDGDASKTEKVNLSVSAGDSYRNLSGIEKISELEENTTYTVSAGICFQDNEGTEQFSQTITLPDVTTAVDVEYDFAAIMPDKVLRTIVAKEIDPTGNVLTADSEKIKKSQLEKVSRISDTRERISQEAVTSLKGIEYLTNLRTLIIENHELTDLSNVDFGPLVHLRSLNLEGNDFASVMDFSAITNLESLDLSYNCLTEDAIASIRETLPSGINDERYDNQRTEGITLLAEPTYYRVGNTTPIFIKLQGTRRQLQYGEEITAFINGTEKVFLQPESGYSGYGTERFYYLPDSGLEAGDTSHTLNLTIDDTQLSASFTVTDQDLWYERQCYSQDWRISDTIEVHMTKTDKVVEDFRMQDASGKVYGVKSSLSSSSYGSDDRYTVTNSNRTYGVYQVMTYRCSLEQVYNRTPAGSYDLVLVYEDGSEETLTGAIRVMGENQPYITGIRSEGNFYDMGDVLYLNIIGEHIDFTKLNYQATDQEGTVHTLSYVSHRAGYGGGDDHCNLVKLESTGTKPEDHFTLTITAKEGYDIEIPEGAISLTYYSKLSGIYYLQWNQQANAMEVAMSRDLEVSKIRVEMKKLGSDYNAWYGYLEGEEFLSGETTEISQGFALVPLRNSFGGVQSVGWGTYRIKIYLNDSEEYVYNDTYSVNSNYYCGNDQQSPWVGPDYFVQGSKGLKWYCYLSVPGYYKNGSFRAVITDSSGATQLLDLGSVTDTQEVFRYGTDYLKVTVADSKDFCDLTPGSYSLGLYYTSKDGVTKDSRSVSFEIKEKGKFLLNSQKAVWISEDTIQLTLQTANLADAEKLRVQMYDEEGNEVKGLTARVQAVEGDKVYLNVKGLLRDTAHPEYYLKVTHSEYGSPYCVYDSETAYYTDDKGVMPYPGFSVYDVEDVTEGCQTVGVRYRGLELPVTIEAYLPGDTTPQASFKAEKSEWRIMGNGYEDAYYYIPFSTSFIESLPDQDRMYQLVVKDQAGHTKLLLGGWNNNGISTGKCCVLAADEPELRGISSTNVILKLTVGATATCQVIPTPSGASLSAMTWTSRDESVATVDNGVVTAVAKGHTYIIATVPYKHGTFSLQWSVTVADRAAAPAASPDPQNGEVERGTVVSLTSETQGADIYYTLNGKDPTKGSAQYNAERGIVIHKDTTIRAIAVKNGYIDSEIAVFSYQIKGVTVTFDADGGTPQTQTQKVDAGEYLDEDKMIEPEKEGYRFAGWFTAVGTPEERQLDLEERVTENVTYTAKWEEAVTLPAPEANYKDGTSLPEGAKVTLQVKAAEGAVPEDTVIYYTLDGSEPATGSRVYTGAITLSEELFDGETITLRTVAAAKGCKMSSISTYTYSLLSEENKDVLYGDINSEDIPEGEVPEGLWIAGLKENGYTYTGTAIKPSVRVYYKTKLLKEKTDYKITYGSNINVPKDDAAQPFIRITGKGNYSDVKEFNFKIIPKNIGDADVTAADIYTVYNNKEQKKAPVLKWGKKTLSGKNGKDYVTDYGNGKYTQAGRYRITLTGQGNYKGTRTLTETILEKNTEYQVSKLKVTMKKKTEYTGSAITAGWIDMKVKNGNKLLVEGVDYELDYRNNKEVGTATVIIKGLHEYKGTKEVTFKITGISMGKVTVAANNQIKDLTYEAGKTEYTQNINAISLVYRYKFRDVETGKMEENEIVLRRNRDYTVSYRNNTAAGKAEIIFTGKGRYTGTLKKTFKITPCTTFEAITVDYTKEMTYCKGGVKPEITVKMGDTELVNGKDYTVSYQNNKKLYTGELSDGKNKNLKEPIITITGKGNYKGVVKKGFHISPKEITEVGITAADVVYKNKRNNYKTKIVLQDTDGKTLKAGTDYEAPTYYADGKELQNGETVEAGTQVTVKIRGKGNYAANSTEAPVLTTTFWMAANDFSKVKLSGNISDKTYTGSDVVLTIEEILKETGLYFMEGSTKKELTAEDIESVAYQKNRARGTAKITLKGKAERGYAGQKTLTFKIVAKNVSE